MRRYRVALLLLGAGVVLAVLSASGSLTPVLDPIASVLGPVTRTLGRWGLNAAHAARTVLPWGAAAENPKLRRQLAQLSIENSALATRLLEVRAIEALQAKLSGANLPTVVARVVLIGPDPAVRQITVDRGSRDGVHEGDAVLSTDGFVIGRVRAVTERRAQVRLLLDPASRLTVVTGTGDQATGVLVGDRGLLARLTNLRRDFALLVGAPVRTAGLDLGVPKNLPVGDVAEVTTGPSDLFHVATVLLPLGTDIPTVVSVVTEDRP